MVLQQRIYLLLVLASALGCASVHEGGREILRVGPLRGEVLRTTEVALPSIDAGTEIFTDEEYKDAQRTIQRSLQQLAGDGKVLPGAQIVVDSCRVRGGAGRRNTTYVARCRLSLRVGAARLAIAEGRQTRLLPARAVSKSRAAEIKKMTRNPLLDKEQSKLALVGAAVQAARILLSGPEADGSTPALLAAARERVTTASSTKLAAALIDLARLGGAADGALAIPHLADDNVLVRRSAAHALSELCPKGTLAAVRTRLLVEKEEAVRDLLHRAKRRAEALKTIDGQ